MAEMPIVDLSGTHDGNGQIDWSQPQPFGTWRCANGWETSGYQCGCLERATTDVLSEDIDTGRVITEHLCTAHALIAQLMSINGTLDRQADEMHTAAHAIERHEELLSDAADRLERAIGELSGNVWTIHRRMLPWPYRAYQYAAYCCGRVNTWRRERKQARQDARIARDRRGQLRRRVAEAHADQMRAYAVLNPVDLDTELGEEVTSLDNDRRDHGMDAFGESDSV